MSKPSLFQRMKSARIVQVLVVYLGASWAVLQVADLLQQGLNLPNWVIPVSVILLLVGLVIILATAWIQSLPSTTAREEAGELPTDWEIAPGDALDSLKRGRLPHLTWGRAILGGVMALLFLFGSAGTYVFFTGARMPIGPLEAGADEAATGIAVVPFSVNSQDLEVWREGMVDLLSTGLDGLGGFRAIDSRTVLARWGAAVGDAPATDLEDALRVAGATGARYAVVGSAVSLGGQVRLTGEVYDVADGSKVGQAQVEGAPDEVLALADRLAVDVIRELLGSQGSEVVSESQVASLSTSSVDALRSYLEGEALIRSGEFERAASAYEEAVDQDSTFAMAYYRLTLTYGWMEAGGDRAERADLALRALSETLPPRDRLLLEGEQALAQGDPAGIPLMEQAVKRYPDDPDAWALLGEHYVHLGHRSLSTVEDSYRAYRTAVDLDPTFAPNYIHLTESGMRLGRIEEARSLLDEYLRLAPDTHQGQALGLGFDLQFGDESARAAALSTMTGLEPHVLSDLTNGLAFTAAGWDALAAVADLIVARNGSPFWRERQVAALANRGRLEEAQRISQAAEDGPSPRDVRVLQLAGDWGGEPLRSDAATCSGSAACLLILGADAVAREDAQGTEAVATAFEEHIEHAVADEREGYAEWLRTGLASLQAYERWKAGDGSAALQDMARLQSRPSAGGLDTFLRLWMGEIAAKEGRIGEAIRYLDSLWESEYGWWGVLRKARLFMDSGDEEAAKVAYGVFLELWSDAPADHPFIVEARDAVGD
jgi:tetratricopeptide (TPR) repeat protein